MLKNGIVFKSVLRHKIFVGQAKIVEVNGIIYLRNGKKIIAIKNVKNVLFKNNCVYFTGCGYVHICFNCKNIFRQFNLMILSSQFDLSIYKQKALQEILTDPFALISRQNTKQYLKILKNILKIDINNGILRVSKNLYDFKYQIIYKVHNVTKKINVC